MTDNEIKKALECCYADELKNYTCDECPYKTCGCSYALCKDALDLINRQQAEIERLQNKCEDRAGCTSRKCDCANIKAEAIKNHCYKKCKYFNNDVVCKALQEEQNCYQCIITELDLKREEVKKLRKTVDAYELENQKLKIVLGDKILEEMVGEE